MKVGDVAYVDSCRNESFADCGVSIVQDCKWLTGCICGRVLRHIESQFFVGHFGALHTSIVVLVALLSTQLPSI